MRKHIGAVVLMIFIGLFTTTFADARGHDPHDRYHKKEQRKVRKAYQKGYKHGVQQAYRYERRVPPQAYYHKKHRRYRHHPRYTTVPLPHPPVRGGSVSIHIPLPPHPGLR